MMTDFQAWTPPPGAVVEPPVHVETLVDLFYSDASHSVESVRAGDLNWSSVGDGPSIVAYAVVQEYKPAPREWWAVGKHLHDSAADAIAFRALCVLAVTHRLQP